MENTQDGTDTDMALEDCPLGFSFGVTQSHRMQECSVEKGVDDEKQEYFGNQEAAVEDEFHDEE